VQRLHFDEGVGVPVGVHRRQVGAAHDAHHQMPQNTTPSSAHKHTDQYIYIYDKHIYRTVSEN